MGRCTSTSSASGGKCAGRATPSARNVRFSRCARRARGTLCAASHKYGNESKEGSGRWCAYGTHTPAAPPRRAGLRSWLAVRCTCTAALYLTVPPVLSTAGVPQQREARIGAPPLLRRLRRTLLLRAPFVLSSRTVTVF